MAVMHPRKRFPQQSCERPKPDQPSQVKEMFGSYVLTITDACLLAPYIVNYGVLLTMDYQTQDLTGWAD